MKKQTIAKIAIAAGLLLGGGAIGYAASDGLQNLSAIRNNFDTVFATAKSQKESLDRLNDQLAQNDQAQQQLKDQIAELQKQVDGKNDDVENKQNELDQKQQELDQKQQEADQLQQQLDQSKSANEQLEQRVEELKHYTDEKVAELQ